MQTIFFLTDDTALSTDDPLHLRKNIFKILDDKIKITTNLDSLTLCTSIW